MATTNTAGRAPVEAAALLGASVIRLPRAASEPVKQHRQAGRLRRAVAGICNGESLRPGVLAVMGGCCHPANRGVVVRVVGLAWAQESGQFWRVEAVRGNLLRIDLDSGLPVDRAVTSFAMGQNLRRLSASEAARRVGIRPTSHIQERV